MSSELLVSLMPASRGVFTWDFELNNLGSLKQGRAIEVPRNTLRYQQTVLHHTQPRSAASGLRLQGGMSSEPALWLIIKCVQV